MSYMIKELRNFTGMTQRAFAKAYGIPLSTLCKWEQGESTPAKYVIELIARTIPETDNSLKKIKTASERIFYYKEESHLLMDTKGNEIKINENLSEVKEENLEIYLEDLFDSFYEIQEKFERDCRYDKESDIIWSH